MLKPVPQPRSERSEVDSKSSFWELIGLRVQGMKEVLIGAVQFQRQSQDSLARRALSHYLSAPPSGAGIRSANYPPHLLQVAIRAEQRGLKEFVLALNRGEEPRIVLIDLEMVQLCFDFRRSNPSIERDRFQDQRETKMSFRTIDGHVVTGVLHSPLQRLRRSESFMGLTDVVQLTALGDLPMPNLIIHRGFFSVVAETEESKLPIQVFDPATDAAQPLIGAAAWRFFMARRPEDDVGQNAAVG